MRYKGYRVDTNIIDLCQIKICYQYHLKIVLEIKG